MAVTTGHISATAKAGKLAAWLRDLVRRAERTSGLGDKTTQFLNQHPADLMGTEDFAVVQSIPSSGLLVGAGQVRVGEYEV